MTRGRKPLKEATLPAQTRRGTTDGNKNNTAETTTQNLFFFKNVPNMQKNTGILPTLWNRKRTEVRSQKELSQSRSECSFQGVEMTDLFFAVVSFHAVLIQYHCSCCAIFWRDFPICRFRMMKTLILKSLGNITVQTTGFHGVLAEKFHPANWLGNHRE